MHKLKWKFQTVDTDLSSADFRGPQLPYTGVIRFRPLTRIYLLLTVLTHNMNGYDATSFRPLTRIYLLLTTPTPVPSPTPTRVFQTVDTDLSSADDAYLQSLIG